jgi:hypothetical protein
MSEKCQQATSHGRFDKKEVGPRTANSMRQAVWRWAERGLVAAAVCSMISCVLLEVWFLKTAPTTPVFGGIHAIKWHGTIVYLTDAQQLQIDTLFWGGPVLLLMALGVNLWSRSFRN